MPICTRLREAGRHHATARPMPTIARRRRSCHHRRSYNRLTQNSSLTPTHTTSVWRHWQTIHHCKVIYCTVIVMCLRSILFDMWLWNRDGPLIEEVEAWYRWMQCRYGVSRFAESAGSGRHGKHISRWVAACLATSLFYALPTYIEKKNDIFNALSVVCHHHRFLSALSLLGLYIIIRFYIFTKCMRQYHVT